MAVLNVRGLPKSVHARLRLRAARAGRSMEAEARAIIRNACEDPGPKSSPQGLQEWVSSLYGSGKPEYPSRDLIRERRREARRG